MADLKMKLNTNNELRLKMQTNQFLNMTIDDFQRFQEEDPIFKNSPVYSITYQDITSWNNKSNFSGNYNDLYNKPNLGIYATINFVNAGLSNKVNKEEGMGLSQNSFTTEEKNKLASLENYDDTAIVNELANKADISDIPTEVSELINDSGYITKDVDDLTNYPTNSAVDAAIGGKQNIIDSENMLSSDLVDDTNNTNKFVTASDITAWNNKSDFSGDYNDLTNKPTIPTLTSQLTNDSGFVTNTYSTSESICGKWIHNETLYRKVYEFSTLSGNYTIDSFDKIISISGMMHRKDYDIYIPVNGRHNDSGWATSFGNIQGTGLAFIYGNSWNSATFDKLTVIIEYTKTSS